MRRQDIQLLALARQGDTAARCEVGRRYLLGIDGFPRHVATGLEHLNHPQVRELPAAALIIAESLPLAELLDLQQDVALTRAARAGSMVAQLKLGTWLSLRAGDMASGREWLAAAARQGDGAAAAALAAAVDEDDASAWLKPLQALSMLQLPATALHALRHALALPLSSEPVNLAKPLRSAMLLSEHADAGLQADLAALTVQVVQRAEAAGQALHGLPLRQLFDILEQQAGRGDRAAAYALGRALCGLACVAFDRSETAEHQNMRRGAAFLLRAADAGQDEAWLHLYQLHADHRLSVANPQMARFFLEKGAASGQAAAQRKLGALLLREAASLPESEQAIRWLHRAAAQDDASARVLLHSLVLPVSGADEDVADALEQIRRSDPWLACRLQLARHFGLTRLEALCVDPVEGLRPWGLVVGRNPFIAQSRLAAPRAVPALSAAALAVAREAASLFGHARGKSEAAEGDLRKRSARQRRAFEQHGLDDEMFFAEASSTTLEALRLGPKWAFRARQPLQLALAA